MHTTTDTMTPQQALDIAETWVTQRKQVRAQLVAMARQQYPHQDYLIDRNTALPGEGFSGWRHNTVRKLHQFPGELSTTTLAHLAQGILPTR